jgi:hypothetical protein
MTARPDAKPAAPAPGDGATLAQDSAQPGELTATPLLVAGPVSSEEELQSVQQIALVTQWMLLFSAMTKAQVGKA